MKKIVGSVATLAALVLGSYYGTGLVTERTLKKNVLMMNQNSGISVDVARYERGLFKSNVQLTWQIQSPAHYVKKEDGDTILIPSKTYAFDMPITIYHGPVIYADHGVHFGLGYAHTQLTLPDAYMASFKEHFSSDSTIPSLEVMLFVTYLNEAHIHLDVPAFHLILKDGHGEIQSMGMNSDHYFSSTMKKVRGQMTVDGVRITQDNQQAILDKVSSSYDLHQSINELYMGDMQVNVPSVVVMNDSKIQFAAKGIQVKSTSDVDNALFDSSIDASFDKVVNENKTYGPGEISFAIKHLDAVVLGDLNEKMSQMQQKTEIERQQAVLALLPELPKLFSKGADLELSKLHVVIPEGALDAHLSVTLPTGDISNPFQLIQKIDGEGKVSVPMTLVQEMMLRSAKSKLAQQTTANTATEPAASEAPSTEQAAAQPVAVPEAPLVTLKDASAPVTTASTMPVDVEQQAKALADQRIADLLKVGALVENGQDYVIDLKFVSGQLSVNGHSFNPGMLQF